MSGYAVTAQFYDAMASGQHDAVNARITEALADIEADGNPVVDIGAGTGLTTQVIARALPEVEILAVEPDPAMRPAIMARVWSDPDLRRRVSILPMSILDAPLPPVIAGAVASATIVHFSPGQREQLWTLLSTHLSSRGCAVIEIQCPIAEDVPDVRVAKAKAGRVAYEGWASAKRIDDSQQYWRVEYIAHFDGIEIDRQCTEYVCWAASAETVLAEADAAGLSGYARDNVVVLRNATLAG